MNTREPLMPEAFFAETLRYIDEAISTRDAALQERPVRPQIGLYANFRDRYEQIFLGYSSDETVNQLASRFPAVVDAYEAYVRCPAHTPPDLADLDRYVVSLWLVSFAILFCVDDSLWHRLLSCIGNEGRDALFEAVVAARSPNRKKATGLLHAKIFQSLFDSIAAEGEQRSVLIRQYLKAWYKALKNGYWVDSHKGKDGGGFFGYWAVEAAGVVAAFGMDDAAFRDMPYYPRDLR
jgi:Domain of unknown function (DUF1911)/Domain of unknown function (DUF1910)